MDPAPALAARGVVAYLGADDIPGANQVGPVFNDEELFASKEVHSVGFVIGVVVADTHQNALDGAKLVQVEYKELPHVLTIEVPLLSLLQPHPLPPSLLPNPKCRKPLRTAPSSTCTTSSNAATSRRALHNRTTLSRVR